MDIDKAGGDEQAGDVERLLRLTLAQVTQGDNPVAGDAEVGGPPGRARAVNQCATKEKQIEHGDPSPPAQDRRPP